MPSRCPICNKPVEAPSAAACDSCSPFCSHRCKLIDLGRWLDGKYQIPVAPDDQDDADHPAPSE